MSDSVNGFLTEGDRKLLAEENPDGGSTHWYRIRERTKSAFRDFHQLNKHLPEKHRDMIFEKATPSQPTPENKLKKTQAQWSLYDGMVATVALLYEGHRSQSWDFETFLWTAINEAHTQNPRELPEREVDRDQSSFEPELKEPRSQREKAERGEEKWECENPLTEGEVLAMIEYNLVPEDQTPSEFAREQRRLRATHEDFEDFKARRPWTQEEENGED